MKLYAEDLPYWDTTTGLARNQERIERELEKFGAGALDLRQMRKGDRVLWAIRFDFSGRTYRFEYMPYEMKFNRELRGKPRLQQAVCQMAARAYHEIKAVLTAAAFDIADNPDAPPRAMFGYLEAPGASTGGAFPARMSDLEVDEICAALDLPYMPSLPGRSKT